MPPVRFTSAMVCLKAGVPAAAIGVPIWIIIPTHGCLASAQAAILTAITKPLQSLSDVSKNKVVYQRFGQEGFQKVAGWVLLKSFH